ncbi:signal peptidase I [Brevibacterium album]|uniref:signal peptidase I n=1 Tax=Brevibacterium album TaxID=417948 RepID=UPI000420C1B6|nr:signal peptidase I [Brevibacterium album]
MADHSAAEGPGPAIPTRSLPRRIAGHPLAHLVAAFLVLGLVQAFLVKPFMVPSESMEETLQVGDRILVNRLAYAPPWANSTPENGDVVVFHTQDELWPSTAPSPEGGFLGSAKHLVKRVAGDGLGIGPGTEDMLVKRVIAVPGQTVECCDAQGRLLVDGEPLDEPYVHDDLPFVPGELDCASEPRSQRCFPPVTVPEGMLLMLGDHRARSADGISQCRGLDAETSAGCVRWARTEDVTGRTVSIIWPLGRFGGLGS